MKKILVATKKPFHPNAIKGIKKICSENNYDFAILEKYDSQDALIDAVKDANALIVRSDKITKEVIDAAQKLEIVVRGGAGYDNIDLKAATEKNIVVMNTPGQNSNAVAELALGMMVYLARGQFNGKPGTELKNKKLGILAYGNVGKNIARIAKGFDMDIYAFDAFVSKDKIEQDNIKALNSAEELFETCQYISLNIPSNEKTKESINKQLMSKMPENAVVVNTARKEIMNENDLLEIMEQRPDFKYISDVAPVCADTFKEKYEGRFYFTPKKMGAQTAEANINAGLAGINQIVKYFKEADTTFKVN